MDMDTDHVPLAPCHSDTQQQQQQQQQQQGRSLEWSEADAAHLGPSRITITRFYQRAPKAPYHRLDSQFKMPSRPHVSPGPQKKKRCISQDAAPAPAPAPAPDRDNWSEASDQDAEADVEDNSCAPALALVVPSPRFSSAPPEHLTPPEGRPKPRISDDTAILHAFLAKANKRSMPVAKRESLENRRDSGAVRQALASTEKPDVLGDLDVNSPIRHASASPEQEQEQEQEQEKEQGQGQDQILEKTQTVEEVPASTKSKPRRTLRVRNKRVQSPLKPAKITIRSAADQVALKRTEAQDLSLATRNNTRKNKGKSMMPLVRLQNLAEEEEAPVDVPTTDEVSEDVTTTISKPITKLKWDETLVYYKEASPETEEAQSPRAIRAIRRSKPAISIPPPPSTSVEESTESPVPEQPQPQSRPKPTPTTAAVSKRKSRIATPARPAKPSIPTTSVTTTIPPPPPQKLFQPPPPPPPPPVEPTFTTPKKSAAQPTTSIGGAGAGAGAGVAKAPPKLDFQSQLSSLPGLSSPAKKRGKPAFGAKAVRLGSSQRDTSASGEVRGTVPGLTSPAKRKRSVVRLV